MNFVQGLKMAVSSILANKMRSLLTMLGIIIGVMSVIALVAIGQGTTKAVMEQVQGLGTNLVTVNITGRGSTDVLSYEKALSLSQVEGVKYVSPVNSQSSVVKRGIVSNSYTIMGTTLDYMMVQDYELSYGRFISQLDLDEYQRIAILGSVTAEELFGFADPIGDYVQINGIRHKVVGVLQAKGESSRGSGDEIVIIPLTSAERLFQSKGVRTIYVQAQSEKHVSIAKSELEDSLTEIFRGNTNSFRVTSQEDLLATVTSVSDTLTIALAGIAGISLLVGGIGIMNIMLVSVTERTREIGIRKAVGAKKRDVLVQFLIEAMALSGLGGLLGIGIGVGVALLASDLLHIDVFFSPNIMMIAFGFSVFVGVIFGIFPANKAAKLRPIDALRYE